MDEQKLKSETSLSQTLTEDIKEQAKAKLEKELEKAEDEVYAEPIISYLVKRCMEDVGLAEDVMQKHKTWEKCFKYILSLVREHQSGSVAYVPDDTVYEWSEDYYHLDDKALEEKKAKEEAERKKKEKTADVKYKISETKITDKQKVTGTVATKPKKRNNDEMDGQIDLFSIKDM